MTVRSPVFWRPLARRHRYPERGMALIAAIVGTILIASAVAGIMLLARQAELAAEPASRQAQLQSFAADGVRFCARVIGVLAGQDPDGILDLDQLVTAINISGGPFTVSLAPGIDTSRSPMPPSEIQGDNAVEQEMFVALQQSDPYNMSGIWQLDRQGVPGKYVPQIVLRQGAFTAYVDLDAVGGGAVGGGGPFGGGGGSGGSGGGGSFADCNMFEWSHWNCEAGSGGGPPPEFTAAGNPVPGVFQADYWYRCRVDAEDAAGGGSLTVDTLIRR